MEDQYHIIVVGGGTSGLMAAIQAAQQGAKVLIVEKNPVLGRKILLSGGGRCNVTNNTSLEQLIRHIPGNGAFLYGALSQFDQHAIIEFFQSLGVLLKEEDHGRMFPVTDRARTIVKALIDELDRLGVDYMTRTSVADIILEDDQVKGIKTASGKTYCAKSVILSVGGRAYPRTGSSGDGYAWVRKAGHSVTRLYATEAPLLSKDPFIVRRDLQGVSLRDVQITAWTSNQRIITQHRLDMIFTHFGFSGPAILRTSGHVNQYLYQSQESEVTLTIDLRPDQSVDELKAEAEKERDRQVSTIARQWVPERLALFILKTLDISPTTLYRQLTHGRVDDLMERLKGFPMTTTGSQPIEKGFVTGGGVNTDEVNPSTMASKKIQGLYLTGELLDINGYTGGYNITAAFVTGAVAGRHAAWNSF